MTAPVRSTIPTGESSIDVYTDGDPDAEPLVLLHPWFGCWRFWLPTMQLLPDRWCIAPDFYSLCHGDWDGLADPRGLMRAVLASLDELGIERADVVGNSVGGIVAQILAAEHPERVRRLVLVGTGPYTRGVSPQFAQEVAKWIDDPDAGRRSGAARAVAAMTQSEIERQEFEACVDIVESADPHFIASVLRTARPLDLEDHLSRIAAPTLIVRGTHDPIRTRAHSEALLAGIAGSRDIELPRTGHAPYVDDPTAFVVELRGFLAEEVSA